MVWLLIGEYISYRLGETVLYNTFIKFLIIYPMPDGFILVWHYHYTISTGATGQYRLLTSVQCWSIAFCWFSVTRYSLVFNGAVHWVPVTAVTILIFLSKQSCIASQQYYFLYLFCFVGCNPNFSVLLVYD